VSSESRSQTGRESEVIGPTKNEGKIADRRQGFDGNDDRSYGALKQKKEPGQKRIKTGETKQGQEKKERRVRAKQLRPSSGRPLRTKERGTFARRALLRSGR